MTNRDFKNAAVFEMIKKESLCEKGIPGRDEAHKRAESGDRMSDEPPAEERNESGYDDFDYQMTLEIQNEYRRTR